jgi:hypothetical protein
MNVLFVYTWCKFFCPDCGLEQQVQIADDGEDDENADIPPPVMYLDAKVYSDVLEEETDT